MGNSCRTGCNCNDKYIVFLHLNRLFSLCLFGSLFLILCFFSAIEKKAKELGYQVKVETRGSGGAKNVLTDDEIAKAAGVIVACDTNVPTDRFDGKKVIECQVSDGINKAEELIKRIAAGDAPVFKASGKKEASHSSVGGKESIGHQIYKHLMNGVSHMLPFVVGGGILIAIAFLIDGFSVDLNSLPADQRANFGTITQAAAMFKVNTESIDKECDCDKNNTTNYEWKHM